MNKTLVTVGAVHTHTYTHTDISLLNLMANCVRDNEKAYFASKVGFVCDAQKIDST